MSGLSTPVTPLVPAPLPDGEYVPGACNIGPWEVRRRRMSAIFAFGAAAVLLAILVVTGAPPLLRLALVLPLWGGTVAWLQARRRFCVAFAMAGLANFGNEEASRRSVVDPAQRELDRRATAVLLRDAFVLAIVPTVIGVLLPV